MFFTGILAFGVSNQAAENQISKEAPVMYLDHGETI